MLEEGNGPGGWSEAEPGRRVGGDTGRGREAEVATPSFTAEGRVLRTAQSQATPHMTGKDIARPRRHTITTAAQSDKYRLFK